MLFVQNPDGERPDALRRNVATSENEAGAEASAFDELVTALSPAASDRTRPESRAAASSRTGDRRLLAGLMSPEAYLAASRAAGRWGVPVYRAAIALGLVSEAEYAAAVGRWLGLPVVSDGLSTSLPAERAADALVRRVGEPPARLRMSGADVTVLSATSAEPVDLARRADRLRSRGETPVVATEAAIVRALGSRASDALLARATRALARRRPDVSASRAVPFRQLFTLLLAVGVPLGVLAIFPRQTLAMIAVSAAVFFAGVVAVRTVALYEVLGQRRQPRPALASSDRDLPVYSVLVPLVDEADVLDDLVAAMSALDYPAAKLDIILVLEQRDERTRRAVAARALPPFIRTVVVPDGAPRTKPKALNYALAFARGDYLVVYDAEDRPEPRQLRAALDAFATGGPDLACVQAPLNIYNADQSWLSKQFALEYSTLFDATLPALHRLDIPLPLGGTSNHFPRGVIDALLWWDPYNVTEDADLGIRIARRGWRTTTISETTWEEAPVRTGQWFRQRTRWLKGWMQTILVHTRRHRRLRRDLGLWRTIGLHVYMTGLVLSALAHPWLYVTLATGYGLDALGLRPFGAEPLIAETMKMFAILTLVAGYAVSIATNIIAGARRGHAFWFQPLLTPLYWLMISAAAYRALYQLATDPYRWEKTKHGLARGKGRRKRR